MGLIASDVSEDDIVILREYQRFFAEYLDIFEKNFNFKVDPTKVTGRMVKSLSEALSAVDAIDDHFWNSWKDVVQLFDSSAILAGYIRCEHSINSREVVDQAFSCPFQRLDTSLSLLKHVGLCLEEWNSSNYFSPYAEIHNA